MSSIKNNGSNSTPHQGFGILEELLNAITLLTRKIDDQTKKIDQLREENRRLRAVAGGNMTNVARAQQLRQTPQLPVASNTSPPKAPASVVKGLQQDPQREIYTNYPVYAYDGAERWHVPKDWQFPQKLFRKEGWSLWWSGIPGVVRPFRSLQPRHLPNKLLQDKLKLEWRPIFQLMEQAPGLKIPPPGSITTEFIDKSYALCTEFLKTRIGYIWEQKNPRKGPETLTLATWSSKVKRSYIEKHGNETDLANLPQPKPLNLPRGPHPHSSGKKRRIEELEEGKEVGSKSKTAAPHITPSPAKAHRPNTTEHVDPPGLSVGS